MVDLALLILRVVVGAILMGHGAQKLFGVCGGPGLNVWTAAMGKMNMWPPRVWALLSALAEFGGGLLLLLGLLSPLGSLAIMASMLVAIIKVHWSKGFWNTKGGIEFPLTLLTVAAALGLSGPGLYSVDHLINFSLPEPEAFVAGTILVVLGVLLALNSGPLKMLLPHAHPQESPTNHPTASGPQRRP